MGSKEKTIMRFLFFTFCLFSGLGISFGQDIQFSQFNAVDLYQNPAFAGSSHHSRAMLHSRIQWPKLDATYYTYFASYDTYVSEYSSGFGISGLQDYQAGNVISSTQIGLYYSYELHLSAQYAIRAGLQFDAVSRSEDYSSLRFPSQFDDGGFQGGNPTTDISDYNRNKLYGDISSGLLLYSTRLWAGFSVHHLNQPTQSDLGTSNSRLPMKFSVTGGYKFVLNNRSSGLISDESNLTETSITPTFNYKAQSGADQVDFGVYGNLKHYIVAAWYRGIPFKKYQPDLQNNESVVLIAGYKAHNFGISYSYDITVSTLSRARTGGSHEIHLEYIFGRFKRSTKPSRRTPCPKFYGH